MADRLLRERGGKPTGKNWVDRFIAYTPELPVIRPWFMLVQSMKAKYGIVDEDTWNFDESGFMMGKISSQLVVTGSEKPGKQKKLQPGDREWVTLVQGVLSHCHERQRAVISELMKKFDLCATYSTQV
ncbi:transposase [Pyrenophora tritici-repentis]|nr:transposase [Pyrenophora tritici-repentis]